MSTVYGLTPTGFIAPTTTQIQTDIANDLTSTIDAGLDVSADQPIGQVVGIMADRLSQVWQLMSTVYAMLDPDSAEGLLLDNVCAITGTRRRSATYSLVVCTMNLNASSSVPAGSVASVANQPANRWTLLGLWTGSEFGYTPGAVANTGGSTANFSGVFQSEAPGPFVANANTLTQIGSPVIGWNSVTNPSDATPGIPEDTDAILRNERENELAAAGACTTDSMRADLLEVAGVIQAFVFENLTEVVDANGVPGHAFHAIIWDGVVPAANNNDIAQALWNNKPSGIPSYGLLSGTATDSQGHSQTMYFDRAIPVPIYVTLSTTPASLTTQQTQAVKAALAAYALQTYNLGVEVFALALESQALSVVEDVTSFALGVAPSPTLDMNIPIGGTQIATLNTANIICNGV